MQNETNSNNIISSIIKFFKLESCFREKYEPFYSSEIDLTIDTFNNDYHRLGRQRTQYMK